MKSRKNILLVLMCFLGLLTRSIGLNWDLGYHLHPDERMLIMIATNIHFFGELNPHFFNYGSLPLYILSATASFISLFGTNFSTYDGMLMIGRVLSVGASIVTMLILYKTARLLFEDKRAALLASLFYAIAFFPIQNSHFFVVDPFLTLFASLLFYLGLVYVSSPHIRYSALMGIAAAAALTTKVSAILFIPPVFLLFLIPISRRRIFHCFIFILITFAFCFIFMPFAFLDAKTFLNDVLLQTKMNSDPYIFPYTLQYVGTLPYWYYLKNIILWGLGPFISLFSFIGFAHFILDLIHYRQSFMKHITHNKKRLLILLFVICYLLYFLIIGRSAVKFMRYMLPLYPLFCLFAGWGAIHLVYVKKNPLFRFAGVVILVGAFLWTYFFLNIYNAPHTRIAATEWILKHIPEGKTLAVEHWDDRLPIYGSENYIFEELPLYERPDDQSKWNGVDDKLQRADYIIIASNRLYVPLQKLSDCKQFTSCYPLTKKYYQNLFAGRLPFHKIAEFEAAPAFQMGPFVFGIDDQLADESFTVYDHPKIMIFQKNEPQ